MLYFAPTLVAFRRKHHNKTAIAALNFFVGWTFIGWVAALVWSLTAAGASRQ
ncbi:superinfection immunity protein [Burkholderia vietnamiensis]|nr:superinfection immunity protein [Burkholderia vietnamiensis]